MEPSEFELKFVVPNYEEGPDNEYWGVHKTPLECRNLILCPTHAEEFAKFTATSGGKVFAPMVANWLVGYYDEDVEEMSKS